MLVLALATPADAGCESSQETVMRVHQDFAAAGLYRRDLLQMLQKHGPLDDRDEPIPTLEWADVDLLATKDKKLRAAWSGLNGFADLTTENRTALAESLAATTSGYTSRTTDYLCGLSQASRYITASYHEHAEVPHVSLQMWVAGDLVPHIASFELRPTDLDFQQEEVRLAVLELFPERNRAPTISLRAVQESSLGPRNFEVQPDQTIQLRADSPIVLDASASHDLESSVARLTFRWFRDDSPLSTSGPRLELPGAATPEDALFRLEVSDGDLVQTLEFHLARRDPVIRSKTALFQVASFTKPMHLEVTGSAQGARYRWSQLSGPLSFCRHLKTDYETCEDIGPLVVETTLPVLDIVPRVGTYVFEVVETTGLDNVSNPERTTSVVALHSNAARKLRWSLDVGGFFIPVEVAGLELGARRHLADSLFRGRRWPAVGQPAGLWRQPHLRWLRSSRIRPVADPGNRQHTENPIRHRRNAAAKSRRRHRVGSPFSPQLRSSGRGRGWTLPCTARLAAPGDEARLRLPAGLVGRVQGVLRRALPTPALEAGTPLASGRANRATHTASLAENAAAGPAVGCSLRAGKATRMAEYILEFSGAGGPGRYRVRHVGRRVEYVEIAIDWSDRDLEEGLRALQGGKPSDETLRRLGASLRSVVEPAGWTATADALEAGQSRGEVGILTVRSIDAPALTRLPWALLSLPGGQHLADLDRCLVRFDTGARERPAGPTGRGVLMVWSAAGGAVPAPRHKSAVTSSSVPLRVVDSASLDDLRRALDEEVPAALHLLCHGALGVDGNIVLQLGDGALESVGSGRLAAVLRPYLRQGLRLVVLSACSSGHGGLHGRALGSMAQELHSAGAELVVSAAHPLTVEGSCELATTLYAALFGGESIERGLLRARHRLRAKGHADWAALQLHASGPVEHSVPLALQDEVGLPPAPRRNGYVFALVGAVAMVVLGIVVWRFTIPSAEDSGGVVEPEPVPIEPIVQEPVVDPVPVRCTVAAADERKWSELRAVLAETEWAWSEKGTVSVQRGVRWGEANAGKRTGVPWLRASGPNDSRSRDFAPVTVTLRLGDEAHNAQRLRSVGNRWPAGANEAVLGWLPELCP